MIETIKLLEKARAEIDRTHFVNAEIHISQAISRLLEQIEGESKNLTVESLKSLERGKIYALQLTSYDGDLDSATDLLKAAHEAFDIEFLVFGPTMNLITIPESFEVKESKKDV